MNKVLVLLVVALLVGCGGVLITHPDAGDGGSGDGGGGEDGGANVRKELSS